MSCSPRRSIRCHIPHGLSLETYHDAEMKNSRCIQKSWAVITLIVYCANHHVYYVQYKEEVWEVSGEEQSQAKIQEEEAVLHTGLS